jgi:hypothetical protein
LKVRLKPDTTYGGLSAGHYVRWSNAAFVGLKPALYTVRRKAGDAEMHEL